MADSFDFLMSEFLDGGRNEQASRRMGEMMTADRKLRKEFLDQLLMHHLLSEYFGGKKQARQAPETRRKGWISSLWKSVNNALGFSTPSSN